MFLEQFFILLDHISQMNQAAPWKCKSPQAMLTTLAQPLGTHKPEIQATEVAG